MTSSKVQSLLTAHATSFGAALRAAQLVVHWFWSLCVVFLFPSEQQEHRACFAILSAWGDMIR